jgi:adenylylsulfate kinase|tara:strand:- start:2228 stop:2650 length:423 start_codon:yes stop_codon:yes gene_type:complete
MKILICGLPGSGKTTLAKPFAELLGGVWINADSIRKQYDDWDFSNEGRLRQAERMRLLADGVELAGKVAVCDFVCPTEQTRQALNADYIVWMDTIKEGRFDDTNLIFKNPDVVDYRVSAWFDDTDKELVKVVSNYIEKSK